MSFMFSKPFQLGVVTDADEGGTATQSNAPEVNTLAI